MQYRYNPAIKVRFSDVNNGADAVPKLRTKARTTSSLPKFLHVSLGVGGLPLGYEEQDVGLIVRAISFQDFQPMWS